MVKTKQILLFLEEIKYLLFILFSAGITVTFLYFAINNTGRRDNSSPSTGNTTTLAIAENNAEKSPEKFLIDAGNFGGKAAGFKDLLKNGQFLPYFFEKTENGYLAYLRSEKGIQRYELSNKSQSLQLAEKEEGKKEYQEKAVAAPLFQYKDRSGIWQTYELLTPTKLEITEQTKDKVVFKQSFNLKAKNTASLFVGGEIIFVLGFDGANYLNKLTFKLEANENINRLVWETKILDENTETANQTAVKKLEVSDIVINWNDFGEETRLEQKQNINRVYFYEQGVKGALIVDPTISVSTASTTITVQSSDYDNSGSTGFKLIFDSSKGGTIDELYHDNVGIGNTNIVSGNTSYDALFDIEYAGSNLSSGTTAATLTLIEENTTRAVVRAIGRVTTNDIAILDYSIYPNGKIYIKVSLEIHDGERNGEDDMFFLIEDYNGYTDPFSSVDDTNKAAALLPDADGVDAALIPYFSTIVGTVGATSSSGNDYIMITYDSATSGYDDETTAESSWFLDLSEATYDATLLTNKRNGYRNPDTLTYTTGTEWDDAPASPGLEFDGVDDVVNAGSGSSLDNIGNGVNGTGLSVEAWIYPQSLGEGSHGRIVHKAHDVNGVNGWMFYLGSSNRIWFEVDYDGSSKTYRGATDNTITLNVWQHVAVTWDGSTNASNIHIYVNGSEVSYYSTTNGDGSRVTDADEDLLIGNEAGGTRTFDGTIDEVHLWNDIRTQAEIQQNMFKQIDAGDEANLLGYWRLNENTGLIAYDETTNDNDGTISGALWTTGYVPDHYNEAEGAYTLDFVSNELQIDIDGNTYTRYYPSLKIRSYRLNTLPPGVSLEGEYLVSGTNYNLDYKPITNAYFGDELLYYTTFESSNAFTSPDIGNGTGTSVGNATFVTAKYGNGILVDEETDKPYFQYSGNVSGVSGIVEFWYKKTATPGTFASFFRDDDGSGNTDLVLYRNGSDTSMAGVFEGSTNIWANTSINAFDGEWHHIKITYDANTDTPELFIDGVEQTRTTTVAWGEFPGHTYIYIGSRPDTTGRVAGGIIDEFKIYSPLTGGIDTLAKGGNTTDSNEYLFDEEKDYDLDFVGKDAYNRGEYLFIGSDSMFAGMNVDLATPGTSSKTTIFENSFAGGDSNLCDGGDNWSGGNCEDGNTITGDESSVPYSPQYSAKFTAGATNDKATVYKTLGSNYGELYARVYFKLDYEGLGNTQHMSLLYFTDSTDWKAAGLTIYDNAGQLELYYDDDEAWESVGADGYLSLDQWYKLELHATRNATTGTAKVWLDDTEVYSKTDTDTGDRDWDYVFLGMWWGQPNTQLYADNFLIADGQIPVYNWEYWKGSSWADLQTANLNDNTSSLTQDGSIYWTVNPTGWTKYSINDSPDLYYARMSLSNSSGSYSTTPIENFIKTDILNFQYLGNITADNQTIYIGSITPTPTMTPTPVPASLKFEGGLKMEGVKVN